MYGYTRWHWKAQDYSSCIVLYPLQVGCHIICRTKQQWVTVVNSWQDKNRYKCGSCSTCQESMNRCQTTQFKVACPSNIGDMCIHSKMTVQCKTQIFHRLFEGNLSITYSVEVGRLWRCLDLLEVTSMSSVLLSLSWSMFAVAQALTSLIHDCIEWSSSDILSGGADICNCKSSANEWCMIECESIMADEGLIYMVKSIGPRTEPRGTPECTGAKSEQWLHRETLDKINVILPLFHLQSSCNNWMWEKTC